MDLFANGVEDFQKDWYELNWTISCKEDGNIWIDAWSDAVNICLRSVDHLRTDRFNENLTICYDCQKVIKNL